MTRHRSTYVSPDWSTAAAVAFILGLTAVACAIALALLMTMGVSA